MVVLGHAGQQLPFPDPASSYSPPQPGQLQVLAGNDVDTSSLAAGQLLRVVDSGGQLLLQGVDIEPITLQISSGSITIPATYFGDTIFIQVESGDSDDLNNISGAEGRAYTLRNVDNDKPITITANGNIRLRQDDLGDPEPFILETRRYTYGISCASYGALEKGRSANA
jgi:hypothetical protein